MNKSKVNTTALIKTIGYLAFYLASALTLITIAVPSKRYIAKPILPKKPERLNQVMSDYEVKPNAIFSKE